MKKAYCITLLALMMVLTSCSTATPQATQSPQATMQATTSPVPSGPAQTQVVSSASIVNTEAAFVKAISGTGTWIIAITKDLTINQNLTLDGTFNNGKKDTNGKDIIQRKIALYAQDANRNITARYTLTAPKLTINSPNSSIQHGTFKGDLYVNVADFQLVDAKVDGNVYFTTDAIKNSFKMDSTSSVTGKQSVKK